MVQRFQIEDLVAQDLSGVVFRALDTATGRIVAIRRFFPFGADGGGLLADEQSAYRRALGRLAGLNHPALRAVICGDCDPVDGMPFIVTEWVEGVSLESALVKGPLSAHAAADLLIQALEVCQQLSHLLGEEAVWVETAPQSIIVGSAQSGRGFTFWLSPLTWLGDGTQSRGLTPLLTLTEELMGWQDRPVSDHAGGGLGGWLKWLRHAAASASLHEVRERLVAVVSAESPYPAKHLVCHSSANPPAAATPLWLVNLGLACVIIGLSGWLFFLQHAPDPSPHLPAPAATVAPGELHEASLAPPPPVKPRVPPNLTDSRPPAVLAGQTNNVHQQGGVIPWTSRELLARSDDQQVVVEGVLSKIDFSGRKKTLYLLFSQDPDRNAARGAVALKSATADLSESALAPLVGKKVRLHGTVHVLKSFGLERPEVLLKERAAIEVVPAP